MHHLFCLPLTHSSSLCLQVPSFSQHRMFLLKCSFATWIAIVSSIVCSASSSRRHIKTHSLKSQMFLFRSVKMTNQPPTSGPSLGRGRVGTCPHVRQLSERKLLIFMETFLAYPENQAMLLLLLSTQNIFEIASCVDLSLKVSLQKQTLVFEGIRGPKRNTQCWKTNINVFSWLWIRIISDRADLCLVRTVEWERRHSPPPTTPKAQTKHNFVITSSINQVPAPTPSLN